MESDASFDALVGNTDRHPENWGFLIRQFIQEEALEDQLEAVSESFDVRLAPVFDNATSLGYELKNRKIPDMLESHALARYIARGTHHAGWAPGHEAIRGHFELCRRFCEMSPGMAGEMRDLLDFDTSRVDAIIEECREFRTPLRVSHERGELITRLLALRRNALSAAIGEI